MKRAATLIVIFIAALAVPGCPVYGDNVCDSNAECAPGLVCHYYSGRCIDPDDFGPGDGPRGRSCDEPDDCRAGETCTPEGECRPGSCAYHGCVEGYECSRVEGVFECVSRDRIDAGADSSVFPDASGAADASRPPRDGAPPRGDGALVDGSPVTDAAAADAVADGSAVDAGPVADAGPVSVGDAQSDSAVLLDAGPTDAGLDAD